jgi:hypothetical protein
MKGKFVTCFRVGVAVRALIRSDGIEENAERRVTFESGKEDKHVDQSDEKRDQVPIPNELNYTDRFKNNQSTWAS